MYSDNAHMIQGKHCTACLAGIMETAYLDEAEGFPMLTDYEKAFFRNHKNRQRRKRWMAGRLTAKYLLLEQLFSLDEASTAWSSCLLTLDKTLLSGYAQWMYGHLEIIPDHQSGSTILWCGKKMDWKISLSYSHGKAIAAICKHTKIGIDIESVRPRPYTFYFHTFTENEKQWVRDMAGIYAVASDWLYTFLWTIKEAFLKSFGAPDWSVWDFPAIQVSFSTNEAGLYELFAADDFDSGFAKFSIDIRKKEEHIATAIEVSATQHKILTIVYH